MQDLYAIFHGLLAPFAVIGFGFVLVGGGLVWLIPLVLFILLSVLQRKHENN